MRARTLSQRAQDEAGLVPDLGSLGCLPLRGLGPILKSQVFEEFGSVSVSSGGRVMALSMVMGCMGHSPSQGEAGMAPALRSWE